MGDVYSILSVCSTENKGCIVLIFHRGVDSWWNLTKKLKIFIDSRALRILEVHFYGKIGRKVLRLNTSTRQIRHLLAEN